MKSRALICAVLFGVFAFGIANLGRAQKKDEEPKKAADGDELAKLGKARRDAAEKAYKWCRELEDGHGGGASGLTYQLSVQWLHADLDRATKKGERTAAYAAHLQRTKEWIRKSNKGPKDQEESPVILSWRSEAEYWLAKERSGRN